MSAKPDRRQQNPPGIVSANNLYTVDELRARLRIGETAWRTLRRNGLPVCRVSGRAFVLGSDLLEHLATLRSTTPGANGPSTS